jgi:hypothetical protein
MGELSVELAACRQLSELLGLPAPARSEIRHSGEISLEAKQSLLVEKILKEIAEREGGDHDDKR